MSEESEADSKSGDVAKKQLFLGIVFFSAFCYCPYFHTERQGQFASRVNLHSASLRFTLHPKEIQWGSTSTDSFPLPKKKEEYICQKANIRFGQRESLQSLHERHEYLMSCRLPFSPSEQTATNAGAPKMQQAKANKGKKSWGIQVNTEWEQIAKSGR